MLSSCKIFVAFLGVSSGAGTAGNQMPQEPEPQHNPIADNVPVASVPRDQVEIWSTMLCAAFMSDASVSMRYFLDGETTITCDHPQLPWGGSYVGYKGIAELNIKEAKAMDGRPSFTCEPIAVDEVRGTALVKVDFSGVVSKTKKKVAGEAWMMQNWNVATGKLKDMAYTFKNFEADILPAFLTDAEILWRKFAVVKMKTTNIEQMIGDIDNPDFTEGALWPMLSDSIIMLIDVSPDLLSKKQFEGKTGVIELFREMKSFYGNISFKSIIAALMGTKAEVVFAEGNDMVVKVCSGRQTVHGCFLVQYVFDLQRGVIDEIQVMSLSAPEIWEVLQGPMHPLRLLAAKMMPNHYSCAPEANMESPKDSKGTQTEEPYNVRATVVEALKKFEFADV
jgi:hypothetical protein